MMGTQVGNIYVVCRCNKCLLARSILIWLLFGGIVEWLSDNWECKEKRKGVKIKMNSHILNLLNTILQKAKGHKKY